MDNLADNKEFNEKIPKKSAKNQLNSLIDKWFSKLFQISDFAELLLAVTSNDISQQYYGIIGLNELFSKDDAAIQLAIDSNLLQTFLKFLEGEDAFLQMLTLEVLSKIAIGTQQQIQSLLDVGVLPITIRFLKSKRQDILDNAIYLVGNFAADSLTVRDMVLDYGGLEPLVAIVLCDITSEKGVTLATWALANLCGGKPYPEFSVVCEAIRAFSKVIHEFDIIDAVSSALWGLSYLCDGPEESIDMVLQANILPSVKKHLSNENPAVLTPAVRIISNILTGNEEHVDLALQDAGMLDRLFDLLTNCRRKILKKEICWALSNIAAGTATQANLLLQDSHKINKIIEIQNTDTPDVKIIFSFVNRAKVSIEACWVLANLVASSTDEMLGKLCEKDILGQFIRSLIHNEPKLLDSILEGIIIILRYGGQIAEEKGCDNKFVVELETTDGLDKIKALLSYPSAKVSNRARTILKEFFGPEDYE